MENDMSHDLGLYPSSSESDEEVLAEPSIPHFHFIVATVLFLLHVTS